MAKPDLSDEMFLPPKGDVPDPGASGLATTLAKALQEEFTEWYSEDGPGKGKKSSDLDLAAAGADFWTTLATSILEEYKLG